MTRWNMLWCLHKYFSAVDADLQKKRQNIYMDPGNNNYFSFNRMELIDSFIE